MWSHSHRIFSSKDLKGRSIKLAIQQFSQYDNLYTSADWIDISINLLSIWLDSEFIIHLTKFRMSVCISIPSDSLSVFDYCKCIPLNFCQASHSPFFAQNTHIWQIVQMDPGMTIQCPSTITTNNYQQLPTTTINNYQHGENLSNSFRPFWIDRPISINSFPFRVSFRGRKRKSEEGSCSCKARGALAAGNA